MLLGYFVKSDRPTHVVVVNLDYRTEASTTLGGPESLQVFDAATGKWSPSQGEQVGLDLLPGGGKLVRVGP